MFKKGHIYQSLFSGGVTMLEKHETKAEKLAKWCADKGYFSKAELHKYGYENHYIRAWRTACDFVTEGRAKRLTDVECKARNLTTSMAWYEWIEEPTRTEQEEAIAHHNLAAETPINYKEVNKQMAFF